MYIWGGLQCLYNEWNSCYQGFKFHHIIICHKSFLSHFFLFTKIRNWIIIIYRYNISQWREMNLMWAGVKSSLFLVCQLRGFSRFCWLIAHFDYKLEFFLTFSFFTFHQLWKVHYVRKHLNIQEMKRKKNTFLFTKIGGRVATFT